MADVFATTVDRGDESFVPRTCRLSRHTPSIEVNADVVCVGAAVCVYWNTINMADADMLLSGIQRRRQGVLPASLNRGRTCQTEGTIYRHLNCSLSCSPALCLNSSLGVHKLPVDRPMSLEPVLISLLLICAECDESVSLEPRK